MNIIGKKWACVNMLFMRNGQTNGKQDAGEDRKPG